LKEKKKLSPMLVQAQAGEAQVARGFWGGAGKKKSKIAAGSWRGAAQAASRPERGLREVKIWSEILMPVLGRAV
jgi:hypothetical protein